MDHVQHVAHDNEQVTPVRHRGGTFIVHVVQLYLDPELNLVRTFT